MRGQHLYIDISLIKGTSFGASKFWSLIIDDFLGLVGDIF
jgi:hypothetical protein